MLFVFIVTIIIVTMVTLLLFSLQLNWSLSGRCCLFLVQTCRDSPVCPAQTYSSCSQRPPPPADDTLQSQVRSVVMQSDWTSQSDVTACVYLCVCVCVCVCICSPPAPSQRVSQFQIRPQTQCWMSCAGRTAEGGSSCGGRHWAGRRERSGEDSAGSAALSVCAVPNTARRTELRSVNAPIWLHHYLWSITE